jgi:hypothetical protein
MSCFLEPREKSRLSQQGSWGELHLFLFWGFDARNIANLDPTPALRVSTFRTLKPLGSDIGPFKDT